MWLKNAHSVERREREGEKGEEIECGADLPPAQSDPTLLSEKRQSSNNTTTNDESQKQSMGPKEPKAEP